MEKPTKANQTNLTDEITDEIVEQIKAVRDTGKTNMFDIQAVMYYANKMDLFALVNFLSERKNRNAYCEFILYGKRSQEK